MSEDWQTLEQRLDKLSDNVEHKLSHIWTRLNITTDEVQHMKVVLQRIDTTLAHLTDSLNRLDSHLAPASGLGFDKRIDRLEQREIGRTFHIRAIWASLTTAIVAWLTTKFGG